MAGTLTELFVRIVGHNPVMQGLAGGVVIAALNTLGAALVVVWPDPSERALDGALGFAAGVMLSASFTSLILPGIEIGGIGPVLAGFALGVLLLDRADQWVPHIHVVITGRNRANGLRSRGDGDPRIEEDTATGRARIDPEDDRTASVLLFIVAITLHNMPEGLAVGVGFGSGNLGDALALMLAIGIQNIPEGLAVSVAAANAGFGSLFYATLAGVRAGLVEIPLAVFGALAVGLAAPILPYAMGFAAGGMLFVISDEIVPETHARGHERVATLGTMVGVAVMLYLDIVLG
jgi:ZIP family zinc transporter